jgi:hypothetical protein
MMIDKVIAAQANRGYSRLKMRDGVLFERYG